MISKLEAMYAMMDNGGHVLIAVDSTQPGVELPDYLMNQDVVLRFGYNLVPAIPDLFLTPEALVGTLSFQGVPFGCRLPWGAIYSMGLEGTSHMVMWPRETGLVVEIESEPETETPKRHLKLVD